jgi:hypothetical protein
MLVDISDSVKSISARMDRIDSTKIDANLKTILTRMNSMDSRIEVISDGLRTMNNSARVHESPLHSTETIEADQDVAKFTTSSPAKEEAASKDKDLLRRLKRGHLLQFDEQSEEENAPIKTTSLIEKFKYEVR